MDNYFVSWFYVEPADDDNFAPSVGARSGSAEVQAIYWRCIYNLYQTALLTNRDVVDKWIFLTNLKELPTVDGVNLNTYFAENQIEVANVELTRKTPKDWSGAWRNQFYVFDVLDYLKEREGNLVILDTDCVITGSLAGLYQDIEKNGVAALTIDYPVEKNVNGCSVKEMREIYAECFGGSKPEDLVYSGGEICAISSTRIPELFQNFDEIWKVNYKRYEDGKVKLTDEAHSLSCIYYHMGCQNNLGGNYVKRMWTDLKCDTVVPQDASLPIWHLPAEKKFALQTLFYALLKKGEMSPAQVRRLCEKHVWLTKPHAMRVMRWYYRYGILKIKRMLKK